MQENTDEKRKKMKRLDGSVSALTTNFPVGLGAKEGFWVAAGTQGRCGVVLFRRQTASGVGEYSSGSVVYAITR